MDKVAKKSVSRKTKKSNVAFPIVGLGASAGGLQAYTDFFKAMPNDSGMAFVIIHHVDPYHDSLMAELLTKHTKMSVVLARDNTKIEPNHVYVIPPNYFLKVADGTLYLTEPDARRGMRLPIDYFLRSLAQDRKERAIAVILSGTASDGTAGVKIIKENGGMVLAQDPREATQDGMPRSAIATGSVDHVLPVKQMPKVIIDFGNHPYIKIAKVPKVLGENARGSLDDILELLKASSPINFGLYKEGTLLRRIERRMVLKHMENAADYVALLKDSPEEVDKLLSDFLICVTSFFRDHETFEYLEKNILNDWEAKHSTDQPIRVWIPGCATGEEAYSLAILLIEKISSRRKNIKLQIFASDIDENALSVARAGIYPDSIAADVSPARLKRFFIKEHHSYRVTSELRDAVVFANQNILSDAPFSKLDIISCRNLLIYFNSEAQERVFQMFHFALNEGGLLLLGSSETVNNFDDLFKPISKKYRLYMRIGKSHNRYFDFPQTRRKLGGELSPAASSPEMHYTTHLADISQKYLVEYYAPASVLINAKMELLYVQGPADKYLRVPTGEINQDLLSRAREGLRAKLGTTIRKSIQTGTDTTASGTLMRNGKRIPITITVHHLRDEVDNLLLVTFKDKPVVKKNHLPDEGERDDSTAYHQLEQELEAARLELQTTLRDFDRSSAELKAVNEEAMSMNEEFQSTNEELETSKEELQSLNEELTTLNTQLQEKIDDERRISDDLNNLLSSSGIPTLFLDRELNIRRFTSTARDLFNVLSNDIGRPFGDITGKLNDPDLLEDAKKVLNSLEVEKIEVKSETGHWYIRQILPYITQDAKVDGVVLIFSDVTELKLMQQSNETALKFTNSIIDTVREPMLVLDSNFVIVKASRSFREYFGKNKSRIEGVKFFNFQKHLWDLPELRNLLKRILPDQTTIESFEITLDIKKLGKRQFLLNARKLQQEYGGKDLLLLSINDVTDRNITQNALREREARLTAIIDAVPDAIITINEQGIITNFSPMAEEMFGYSSKEISGKNINILMPESEKGKHDGYILKYLETGKKKMMGQAHELDACRKDGSIIPVRLIPAEFWINNQRHFIGILHDLTNEKKRREELQHAQKMEAIGQLTGGIAHDFNNLLTVITGNLELMDMQVTNKKQRILLDEAQEAASLGAKLTSQLLAFSKRQALVPKQVFLNDLVTAMLPLMMRTLGEEITIKTNLSDDLNLTLSDPGQIENALLNLAINASHAMPHGGILMIETRNIYLDIDVAEIKSDVRPGNYVMLTVTDTGIGMTKEVLDRAFEPFFTTKTTSTGSGLGLSMVYGFAKQTGGHVSIYSEVGHGTTINIYLPAVIYSEEKETDDKRQIIATPRSETILVAEDDPHVRRLTVKRLEKLGYDVIARENGPEAIEELKANDDIGLVLSDVLMPGGLTGFELAELALVLKPKMKILLTSGYTDSQKSKVNKHAFLRKPYSIKDLDRALRKLLD